MLCRDHVLPLRCPSVSISDADVGFDPLGFSTTITELGGDLNYVREAELMHGRQAMLAVVGFVAPKLFGKLPVAWTADVSLNPLEAQFEVPPEVIYQVAISIFIAEGLRAQVYPPHLVYRCLPPYLLCSSCSPLDCIRVRTDHLRQGQRPWRPRLRSLGLGPQGLRGAAGDTSCRARILLTFLCTCD